MLIVLEGCDGAGKTTFIDTLNDHLAPSRTSVVHLGPPDGDPLIECLHAIRTYRPRDGEHLLVDRLHVGELVYGPIFRGESKLDGVGARIISQRLGTLGGLLVHVDAPLDVIEDRVGVRGDDYVKVSDLERIHRGYRDVMSHITDVSTMTVDTRSPNAATQVLRIADALERAA